MSETLVLSIGSLGGGAQASAEALATVQALAGMPAPDLLGVFPREVVEEAMLQLDREAVEKASQQGQGQGMSAGASAEASAGSSLGADVTSNKESGDKLVEQARQRDEEAAREEQAQKTMIDKINLGISNAHLAGKIEQAISQRIAAEDACEAINKSRQGRGLSR